MSDPVTGNTQRRLISYFRVYGPQTFRTADGRPLGRRSLQKKIVKFRLPIIRAGKGDPLIDPVAADEVLSRAAMFQEPPRQTPGTPASRRRPARTARRVSPELVDA
jgi:hypothetical protein